jgi:hypothetical protein
MQVLRQGDVALMPTSKIKGIKKENNVVAYGEVSGHHHVAVGDCALIEANGNMYVITGKGKSFLAHLKEGDMTMADHHPIELEPETTYEVRIQNQYNPYSKLMERVLD